MGKPDEPLDVMATNPRYRGAKMSDLARALTLPKDQELRAKKIAEWKAERRSAKPAQAG